MRKESETKKINFFASMLKKKQPNFCFFDPLTGRLSRNATDFLYLIIYGVDIAMDNISSYHTLSEIITCVIRNKDDDNNIVNILNSIGFTDYLQSEFRSIFELRKMKG